MKRWKKINDIIYRRNGIHSSLLPLEFIIGCINDEDPEFYKIPFISGFEHVIHASLNIKHFCLGALLKNGCKIITPNFYCAIEGTFNNYKMRDKLGVPTCVVENDL